MQTLTLGQYDYEHLKIPRKPAWTKEMTAVDIDRREREAFLQWRREIAVLLIFIFFYYYFFLIFNSSF